MRGVAAVGSHWSLPVCLGIRGSTGQTSQYKNLFLLRRVPLTTETRPPNED